MRLATLKRRPEFLRAASAGRKWAARGLLLQVRLRSRHDESVGEESAIRFGLTASKKVGGAVVRNRARRRLRALAQAVLPRRAKGGRDYVLIARRDTATRPYGKLLADLETALRRTDALKGDGSV